MDELAKDERDKKMMVIFFSKSILYLNLFKRLRATTWSFFWTFRRKMDKNLREKKGKLQKNKKQKLGHLLEHYWLQSIYEKVT